LGYDADNELHFKRENEEFYPDGNVKVAIETSFFDGIKTNVTRYEYEYNQNGLKSKDIYFIDGEKIGESTYTYDYMTDTKHYISTEQDLRDFAASVNNGNTYEGQTVTLLNDINLTKNHTPVASEQGSVFNGTFDGNGKTISNLSVSGDYEYAGLFGLVGENGQIKNIVVNAVNITGNNTYVGGLAGKNDGTITNCNISGELSVNVGDGIGGLVGINNKTISNCYSSVNLISGDIPLSPFGGFAGVNNGTISNSYATGDVDGDYASGGFVAHNIGIISNCYATGNTGNMSYANSGGFAGVNSGTITNSYSVGNVYGGSGFAYYVFDNSVITNCYYDSETSGQNDNDGRGNPRTTTQMKRQLTFIGWDFSDIWAISPNINNGYPYLRSNTGGTTSISKTNKSDNRYGILFDRNIVSQTAKARIILPVNEKAYETKIAVYDMTGNAVFETTVRGNEVSWNLTNKSGRFVANGTYLFAAQVKSANGKIYSYSAKLGVKR
jgi:hypothetical protein